MVILNIGAHLAARLMQHVAVHAGVAATSEGAADPDAIHGGYHSPSGPIRAEGSITFQAPAISQPSAKTGSGD